MGVYYGLLSFACRAARCMAYFFSLIFLCFSWNANAFPVATEWRVIHWQSVDLWRDSREGACAAGAAYSGLTLLGVADRGPYDGGWSCNYTSIGWASLSSRSQCPANSSGSGGNCTCNAGFEYDTHTQQCVAIDEKYCRDALRWANAMGGSGVLGAPAWYEGQRTSGVYCDDQNFSPPGGARGCIVEFEMDWSTQVNGAWRTSGIARMMDHGPYACSPADPNLDPPKIPEQPTQPDTCKPPMVAGYVNGQVHCYTP